MSYSLEYLSQGDSQARTTLNGQQMHEVSLSGDRSSYYDDDDEKRILKEAGGGHGRMSIFSRSTSPDEYRPHQGTTLVIRHTQTYIAIGWLLVLVVYVCLMEYVVYAHKLPDSTENVDEVVTFGKQGTPWRVAVVQSFNVIRTVLAVAHVPIVTGTLASTIPPLTQRTVGKAPPKLNAAQLFMLADKSWSGAGGWIQGLMMGNLPWAWWKLTLITMATFAGFPLMTLGYLIDSQQFWRPHIYDGVGRWELNGTIAENVQQLKPKIDYWIHSKPQRNLGTNETLTVLMDKNLAFYPPAMPGSRLGHFISLTPAGKDGDDGLVVANTLGFIQSLKCAPVPQGKEPELIDLSSDVWGCKIDCSKEEKKNLCHARTTLGRSSNGHFSQVASCAKGLKISPIHGLSSIVEIAMKINPDYQASGLPPPFNPKGPKPYSFRAGDKLTGQKHYTEIIQCKMGYTPGQAIVDSVIRKFMHFIPFPVEDENDPHHFESEGLMVTSQQEKALWNQLGLLLNVTASVPIEMLHEYFLASNYATYRKDYNASLPFWFGVQKPGDAKAPNNKYSANRDPLLQDKYLIDNMVRVNSSIFTKSFVGLTNSTLIRALPGFLVDKKQSSFKYLTDVKLRRGNLPIILAPMMLLLPICFVVYISLEQWNTPTWTEFLDAWAMFKLGREWKEEMTGEGAVGLSDSWQAKILPGYVGDANVPGEQRGSWASGVSSGSGVGEHVGHLRLGGRAPLRKGVIYT